MATRPGRDGGSRTNLPLPPQAGRGSETKRRGGDEARPVRARYSIDCFRCSAAARAPPSSLLLLQSPGALAPDGERECGSRAPFPPLQEGDPAEDRRPAGRGMGGRDD